MPPAPAALRTLPGLIWDKVISGIEFSFSHQRQQQQHYFVITAYRTAVVNDMKLVFWKLFVDLQFDSPCLTGRAFWGFVIYKHE